MDSKWIIRIALALVANAALIAIASALLDQFAMTGIGWFFATIVFTAMTVGLKGTANNLADQYASQATWVGGLVLTFAALWLIDIITRDVYLEGGLTWILATVIIWAGTVLYDRVDEQLADEVSKALGR